MKKFFASIIAVLMTGSQINSAVAAINEQDNRLSSTCGEFTYQDSDNTKLLEFRIYFSNDESGKDPSTPPKACNYSTIQQYLSQHSDDIGGYIVIGAADTHLITKTEKDNISLSEARAKWVIDNILPYNSRGDCRWDGTQSYECSTYAMGSANDYAKSGFRHNKNTSNADERAVRVYIRWRFAECPESLILSSDEYLTALGEAKKKYPNAKTKIEQAEQTVRNAKEICKKETLYASQVEELLKTYQNLLDLGRIIPEINIINQQYGITKITMIKTKIESLYAKLIGGKRSVWKNADGGFNTARLASDSIAGVVLGTAGGLITSKIVKKNQLKQGFEDIKCTINGQNVADYGDTMRVGLQ